MTKRNIYINAPLTRRVLSYFIDWYLGALCAAFPIAVVSQKLYGTMLKQNLLKIQQPYGFIAGIIGVIFALFYYIYIPFFVYKGQTVGKRICKVKIIQNNNQEVSLKSLVLRQGLGMIVIEGIFVSASALWASTCFFMHTRKYCFNDDVCWVCCGRNKCVDDYFYQGTSCNT